jgi:hypothetical protein
MQVLLQSSQLQRRLLLQLQLCLKALPKDLRKKEVQKFQKMRLLTFDGDFIILSVLAGTSSITKC